MSERNLLSRAKPELKEAIAAYGVKYPNVAEGVRRELSETNGIIYLRYGTVLELENMATDAGLNFSLINPWEWFER